MTISLILMGRRRKKSNLEKSKIKSFLMLHALMFVFSLSSLFLKFASGSELISWNFVIFFALGFLMLGIYAIFFQQILKSMKLTTAYANKAAVIIWGLLWDILFIKETSLTWGKAGGFILIVTGIYLMVKEDG